MLSYYGELAPLIQQHNYLTKLNLDILLQIIIHLELDDVLNLSIVSKYFDQNISKLIPPQIPEGIYAVNFDFTSVRLINYIEKFEQCDESFRKIHSFMPAKGVYVQLYDEYLKGVARLQNISTLMSHSPHFLSENGHERINKLCENDKKKSYTIKSYITSFFRDPYILLLMITVVLLITATTGWFIYSNTTFNLFEKDTNENILYQYELEKNIKNIDENGYFDNYLPLEKIFLPYRSSLNKFHMERQARRCYDGAFDTKLGEVLCFDSLDELCDNRNNIRSIYFEHVYHKFNKTYNVDEIQNIFLLLSNYVCADADANYQYDHVIFGRAGYLKYKHPELVLFTIERRAWFDTCIGINNKSYNFPERHESRNSNQFTVSKITYDTKCIAECITHRPNLHLSIWYLILILCATWISFLSIMYYGLILL
jgi:hypothetical protein